MGFIGWTIVLIVVAILGRILRSIFKAIDWIAYLLVLADFIYVWITQGFWMGLLAGFICMIVVSLLFGIGGGTKVEMFGHTYTLECDKCGYEHLDITEYTDDGVVTRCRRCGHVSHHKLNH